MENVETIRKEQRAAGTATIMAIGTANPPNVVVQNDFADFYFRVTNNEDKVDLKNKFDRICRKTMIKKRYLHHNEELLKKYPNICSFDAPSLNDRQDICVREVPKLGKQAALKALEEWGRDKSLITHLIMCTSSCVDMPSADVRIAKLLDLRPDVKRYMVYMQGCFAGGTVLRYAKDLAENNKDARVLVVCAELTLIVIRGPDEDHLDNGIGNMLFGDGAAALVVGSDPIKGVEKSIFEIVSVNQRIIPNSEEAIQLHLREEGLTFHLAKNGPQLIANEIEQCLADAFGPVGMPSDLNSLFWIPHPGGRAILDELEEKLNLQPEKFWAARHVLWEYGNMISNCVLYILDVMRRRSSAKGLATTGEGLEWGVLLGFGPGMTVETVVLHSVPI